MSYADVAAVVGVPVGTVRSRLSRGRAALRQLMDTGERSAPAPHAEADHPALLDACH
jgi:DNA-directed RNA polymerase specialized sigma24 family protein